MRVSDGAILGTVGNVAARNLAFDGENVWAAMTKIRASDATIVARFTPGACPPWLIAFDGTSIWAVGGPAGDCAMKVRPDDGLVLGAYAVGPHPLGMAFDGANVWVANYFGNTVTKLRAADGVSLGTFAAGPGPRAVAFDGMNVWVANALDNTVCKR
jgi:hypothetical protein